MAEASDQIVLPSYMVERVLITPWWRPAREGIMPFVVYWWPVWFVGIVLIEIVECHG
jgi:hypothetical protein